MSRPPPSSDAKNPPDRVPSYPFLLPPVEPNEIGRLGNYRVFRLLGRGGMGYVFHAEDLTLHRPVALKVMKPDLEGAMKGWDRFLREARLMAAIKHESLVTVFQAAKEGDTIFLAMELLDGVTLEDWCARNPRPAVADILRLAREMAAALTVIHRHGLVHRDIKPSNLWLEAPHNRIKILDFGLARFVQQDSSLTQSGAIIGTPSYMSPEQARGDPVDPRSDLFSFGCILYFMCTGENPFHAETLSGILTALAIRHPKPVRQLNPSIPLPLSDLVGQLLAKNPEDRPASAEEVLERLERIDRPDSSVDSPTLATKKHTRADARAGTENITPIPARRRKSGNRATTPDTTMEPAETKNRLVLIAIVAAALTVVVVSIIVMLIVNQPTKKDGPPEPPALVYLSNLNPVEKVNWPFVPPPGKKKPPPKGIGSVQVQGKPSLNGIFMHPPPEPGAAASLSYDLGKQYAKFHSQVTYNDGPPGSKAPSIFSVYGDGRLLWQSQPVFSQNDAQICSIDVSGVNRLTIAVTCSGKPMGAHAVWVEPRLTK
jgi:serine/threonine protein kinase